MSSGVKRDARTAELPDEDEQGGKFQQVEGLTTVDAEEIPCESSVEDDFMMDENTEGVNEEIVKAIVAGKKKELDAMEAFGIFDVCEELPRDAKVITTRWENVPKGDKWRCRFVAREFRHDDPEMQGLYTSGSTAATGRLVDMHAVQHGYSILCLDAENAYFHAEEDEDVYCWPPKEWVQRYHARGGRVESPWCENRTPSHSDFLMWKLKRQHVIWKTDLLFILFISSSCEEVQRVCRDGNFMEDGLGIVSNRCPEQPSLFRRPGTTLLFECHQDDFHVSGSNVELAWLQENLGARLKLKPAEPMGPGSQYSYLRATRTRIDADTIHIAPRETYIKNVLDILGLGDNKCKPMPTPIVQTRQKSDEDEPRLGEENRLAFRRRRFSKTSLEVPTRQSIRSPRGQQDARIPRRCRPPKIATTWKVSLGNAETWNHDTKEQ